MSAFGRPLRCARHGVVLAWLTSLAWATSHFAFASTTNTPPADGWFTNTFTWPEFIPPAAVATTGFTRLEAVESVGRLKVIWTPDRMETNAMVRLFASADEPGHWPARDWRPHDAIIGDAHWEFKVPVDDVDVPLAYFVETVAAGRTNISQLRLVAPRRLGIEEPTRFFWSFLEGFESGTHGWWQTTPTNAPLMLTGDAHTGRQALRVNAPGRQTSATLGTTRVRGWQANQPRVRGLACWLRTSRGTATASFALHADAFTDRQRLSVSDRHPALTTEWQRVELPFDSFPGLDLPRVDWFSITLISSHPCEVFMDDLEFLESWATPSP